MQINPNSSAPIGAPTPGDAPASVYQDLAKEIDADTAQGSGMQPTITNGVAQGTFNDDAAMMQQLQTNLDADIAKYPTDQNLARLKVVVDNAVKLTNVNSGYFPLDNADTNNSDRAALEQGLCNTLNEYATFFKDPTTPLPEQAEITESTISSHFFSIIDQDPDAFYFMEGIDTSGNPPKFNLKQALSEISSAYSSTFSLMLNSPDLETDSGSPAGNFCNSALDFQGACVDLSYSGIPLGDSTISYSQLLEYPFFQSSEGDQMIDALKQIHRF